MIGSNFPPVRVAIAMTDGTVAHMLVVARGRFATLPKDGFWRIETDGAGEPTGWYIRDVDDLVISREINKVAYVWAKREQPMLPVSWHRITDEEGAIFENDRIYRNALTMNGDKKVVHDIGRARECHRGLLRKLRSQAMPALDVEFSRYVGRNADKAEAAEAKRQVWRDAPNDPRIAAAASIEDLKKIQPPG